MMADTPTYAEATIEEALKLAEQKDCDVVFGASNVLLCDYDGKSVDQFEQLERHLQEWYGPIKSEMWLSSTSDVKHYHRRITLSKELPVEQRLILQAALGSDPLRAVLAIRRLEIGIKEPSLLFKPRKPKDPTKDVFEDLPF